jgi:hypothetical protein
MKYNLFSEVALTCNLPKYNLQIGDLGTIVEYLEPKENQESGYALEIYNALGDTITVIIVKESQIQPLKKNAVLTMRELSKAVA